MAKQKTPTKKQATTTNVAPTDQFQRLRKWNIWIGILLVVQALAIGIIGTARTYPVTTQYLSVDALASEATGGQSLAAATRILFDVRFAWVVAAFLLVFAVAYLLVATRYRARYERRLQAGINEARWAALGAGGGMILVAVGLISGIYEITALLALLVFMIVGCLVMLVREEIALRTAARKTLLGHLLCGIGITAIAAPLVILLVTAGGAILYDGKLPGFVYGIYTTLALFFVAAALLTHFRLVRQGKWADSFMTERAYMLLAFVGASVLAWQMFAGALLP